MPYADEPIPRSSSSFIRWFGIDDFIPEKATTSYWMSTKAFFAIRLIVTLYSTIIMWTDIGTSAKAGTFSGFFAFFTNMTFIGLHAYLVTALFHHVVYLKDGRPSFFFYQKSFLNYLYVYLYHTIIVFNILTPVVYWGLLNAYSTKSTTLSTWVNVSVHGVSFFLMMSEVIIGRMEVKIRMVLPVFCTVILYMFLTFIVHATKGYWVYPFLNWSQGGIAAAWYILVGVIVIVFFFIQVLFHFIRNKIATKLVHDDCILNALLF
ncbi:hypothetical protein K501DRAFT_329206 [Backusella circina FSU 941]|nr:hypothetical protein K501DRAFT_329206 [Backusella circina FSU 941]